MNEENVLNAMIAKFQATTAAATSAVQSALLINGGAAVAILSILGTQSPARASIAGLVGGARCFATGVLVAA